MDEMTLSSRHRIQNSSPGGLRPSTLPPVTEAPHDTESLQVSGKKYFVSIEIEDQSGARTRDLRLSKQTALTTVPGPPQYPANNVGLMLDQCRTRFNPCAAVSIFHFFEAGISNAIPRFI